MVKRINLTVNDNLYILIEKYKLDNKFSDKQDAIRDILENRLVQNKSFFSFFKNLFK